MFSKAIEEDPTDPVFYTNSKFYQNNSIEFIININFIGAAVYLTIDKLDESVKDCDKAIEINKNFVKVTNILS